MIYSTRFASAIAVSATALAALLVAVAPALAADFSPELRDLIMKAEKEGKLHIAWAQSTLGGAAGARRIEAAMNKMFGTKIKFTFSPGRSMPATSAKIRAEAAAGQPATTDVYLGSSPFALQLVQREIGLRYPWTKLLPGRITTAMVEGDGTAVRFASGLGGVTYNTKLAPMKPTKISDFLKPAWKGKIASTPYAASFDMLSAKGVWGPEKTTAFVRKLAKNIRGLIRCAEGERIATGEFVALVMDCESETARKWAARGAPVAQFLDPDAAVKRQYYFIVPKNSANPNAAALYAVFMMTKEGQDLVWDTWNLDSDLFPGTHTNQLVAKLEKKGAKFAEGSINFVAAHPEVNGLKKTLVKILKSAK
jgi:ABC-type Fe3+ transport system substrate-binding protein